MKFIKFSILVLATTFYAIIGLDARAQTSLPSAFTFSKPNDHDSVRLSPDGHHVASIVTDTSHYCVLDDSKIGDPEKGECEDTPYKIKVSKNIEIYSLKQNILVQTFVMPAGGSPVRLEWASNSHLLATGFWPPFFKNGMIFLGGMRIFSVPLGGEEASYLFSGQEDIAQQNWDLSEITNALRKDPDHIMMPANRKGDQDLWKVNVKSGAAVRVARGKSFTFHWFTDDDGKPVMRFDCSTRSCRKINVYIPDAQPDKWKKIKSFRTRPNEKAEEYDFWPIAQSDDPNQFYVMSYEDEDERQSIKLYDITTEAFTEVVYEHPEVDVTGAFINPLTGAYEGAIFIKDQIDYALKNPVLQKHYETLKAHFNHTENVVLLGFNEDNTKAVVYVTSPNNPGGYHVYDTRTRQVTDLFRRNDDLGDKLATRSKIMKIPVRDGTVLTAYHTQSTALSKGESVPLLVMPHGGPEVRDFYDYDTWAQYFALRGYQVLQVNFRGSSGYGRAFAEAGYGQWGQIMQHDITDTTQYFYDKGLASEENSCIVGYSYGGFAALYAGAVTPDLYACVVSGGGVSDLPRLLKQVRKDKGSGSEVYQYWTKSIGDAKAEKDKLKALSPINMTANYKVPVLLLHGTRDGIVDVEQSEKMHKALIKAEKSVTYVELEGEGHSGWGVRNSVLYLESIEEFLAEHLSGQVKP